MQVVVFTSFRVIAKGFGRRIQQRGFDASSGRVVGPETVPDGQEMRSLPGPTVPIQGGGGAMPTGQLALLRA
jgi:hypothetical protein